MTKALHSHIAEGKYLGQMREIVLRTASNLTLEPALFPALSDTLNTITGLELAILIGSRASDTAHTDSDWDIAIQWSRGMDFVQQLAATEQLRRTLTETLGVSEEAVDLIDLPTARFAMRAIVAEEGKPLKGGDSLVWNHFLQRTWRELEEQYWEQTYAA